MIVQSATGPIGPFKSVVQLSDRLVCDGDELPFSVLGAYTVVYDDSLIPAPVIAKAIPEQVLVVQLKLALLQLKPALLQRSYLDDVEAALPSLGREAQIKWEDSRRAVRRHDELVIAMRDMLLWTDNIVDEVFILAATL